MKLETKTIYILSNFPVSRSYYLEDYIIRILWVWWDMLQKEDGTCFFTFTWATAVLLLICMVRKRAILVL